MKFRDATLAELAPKERKVRELSPRQLAIRKRQTVISKVLADVTNGPSSAIKRVELDEGEKLPAIRAAIAKQIRDDGSAAVLSVRNGAIYLSREPLPRGR